MPNSPAGFATTVDLRWATLLAPPLLYLRLCGAALLGCRALMPTAWLLRGMLLALAPSLGHPGTAHRRDAAMLFDPFGWDLHAAMPRPQAPSALATWHLQVAVILCGHVLGMAIGHRRFWMLGAGRARNWLAQAPLLLLTTA